MVDGPSVVPMIPVDSAGVTIPALSALRHSQPLPTPCCGEWDRRQAAAVLLLQRHYLTFQVCSPDSAGPIWCGCAGTTL